MVSSNVELIRSANQEDGSVVTVWDIVLMSPCLTERDCSAFNTVFLLFYIGQYD